MKNKLFTSCLGIIILLVINTTFVFAQWETHGPYGGPQSALTTSGGNVYAGNTNGVFISSDNGQLWNAANNGIERKLVAALTANNSGVFAALDGSGIYFLATNNGMTWTAKNNGLSNFNVVSLFSADTNLFAGTPDGIFFSPNNGNSWTLANVGIPYTYTVYSFAKTGDTVFAGTYGMGLYRTINNGITWTSVTGGFPAASFVYALVADGNMILAGTSSGVYKSMDHGLTWIPSNTGFPSSMWANTFAAKPGYIFAGTYSEGIFVSTDDGSTWTQKNNGIPDLPFPTGLPHNYPPVQSLITSGSNVIAATINGMYLSIDNGDNWSEVNEAILATDVMAITANSTAVFAGTARTGIYTSVNNGSNWLRSNNGLTSYDVLALTTKNSSVFVSVLNEKVFRSDDNGNTWVAAASGINSNVSVLKSDSLRVFAVTTGGQFTPRAIFQTFDNGATWTTIPTGTLPSGIWTLASNTSRIYVGADFGKLYYTDNNGTNWMDISGSLPALKINSILIIGNNLLVGTDGQGIYKSSDNGSSWVGSMSSSTINDIQQQNGILYASTWGEGTVVSHDTGTSWQSYNTGLADLFVRGIASDGIKLYAGTDAGAFSSPLAVTGINERTKQTSFSVFPNPAHNRVTITSKEKTSKWKNISVFDVRGKELLKLNNIPEDVIEIDLSNYETGLYFIKVSSDHYTETIRVVKED